MKPRLLILSDLFGGKNPEWVKLYLEIVYSKFEIQYYDVLELGNIDVTDFLENNLHNQFLNGGIDKAVNNLLELEKGEVAVLGFSIGGTIAWKAALKGLKVSNLVAVSSTRLRFENEVPNCKIMLYFGEEDLSIPNSKWFSEMKISNKILKNQNHQLYFNKKIALSICKDILFSLKAVVLIFILL